VLPPSLSYVPLVAPATSPSRLKLLCKIADSFIYVVSRMGVTGATGVLNTALPELLERVHKESGSISTAVGFGISTREHFLSVGKIAEGAVIGSQIVNVLADAPPGQGAKAVEEYCSRLTGIRERPNGTIEEIGIEVLNEAKESTNGAIVGQGGRAPGLADQLKTLNTGWETDPDVRDGY
jgi:tryptophan synthase